MPLIAQRALVIALAVLALSACGASDSAPTEGPWRFTPELEVRNTTRTCPDWSHDFPEREPPLDPEVRVLWRWHPYGDPVYEATGLANQYLGVFAVSPDGTIFAIGPEPDRLEALEPTGALRWIGEPLGAPLNDTLAVSPEGEAYGVWAGAGAAGIVRATRDGVEPGPNLPLRGEDPQLLRVTLGSHGRVYVSSRFAIYATCRGRSLDWILRFDGHAVGLTRADADGVWVFTGDGERAIRITHQGEIVESFPEEPVPDRGVTSIAHGATQAWKWTDHSTGETWLSIAREGSETVELPRRHRYAEYQLDAAGGVWVRSPVGPGGASRWERFVDGEQAWNRGDLSYAWLSRAGVASDGSLILVDASGDGGAVARVGPDGTAAWSLPLDDGAAGNLNAGGDILFAADGVVYVGASRDLNSYIVAIQTDAVPVSESVTCFSHGCGPERDSWINP